MIALIRARLVAVILGVALAGLAHLGVEASPEIHAELQTWAEVTAGTLLALAPVVWKDRVALLARLTALYGKVRGLVGRLA